MNRTTILKLIPIQFAATIALALLVTVFACSSDSSEETTTQNVDPDTGTESLECPALEPFPGDAPLGPPPGMPYIFTGKAYVGGEPAPPGEMIWVNLTVSQSKPVEVLENGEYRNIIHGPVRDPDNGVPFVFCLGDPEGNAVKAEETYEYENKGMPYEVQLDLNFPVSPSELSSQ